MATDPLKPLGRAVIYSAAVLLAALTGIAAAPGAAVADEVRDQQWHLDFLDIAKAHQITQGEDVTVAVLDTGVEPDHPDLKGNVLPGKTFAGGDFEGTTDAGGHGTGVASLIAGHGHGPNGWDGVLGIAPEAKVLTVRVTTSDLTSGDGIVRGIKWAADRQIDIINLSLAAIAQPDLKAAVEYALDKGIVIVAGVGNTEKGMDQVMAPAVYPGVIAVSGLDQNGGFTKESVSGREVVLSAPAVDVMAADKDGGYGSATGTSNSAAIVSGVAALVKAKYPNLDAANIVNRLIATADDRGRQGRDEQYGFGVVDPVKALTADVPEVKRNPLLPKPSKSAASPTPRADYSNGFSPAGWATVGVGALVAVGLAIAGLFALRRRTH